jgi:Mg2+ and Co2+ transporter CorA
MYHESNYQRVDKRIMNPKLVDQLYAEKKSIQEKYFSLLDDVKKLLEETKRAVMQRNCHRMQAEGDEGKAVELLQKEVSELKRIHQTQADVLKVRQKAWEEEKKAWEEQKKAWEVEKEPLKEGKSKVEYALYEVFTANDANKEKLRKLKEIMDE